ncbi:SDR family oxidoreductase [Mycobacterium sp. 050134]|uniref:SDR family oxidoreductase n=1 Tax=Mycobacterium sp. 050134 TaxID=3096111 RepID=UPI002ED88528
MQMHGNTVLITGGGSGIGRGLAVALHRAGNRVVVAGRRASALRAVTDAHPGMRPLGLDLADAASVHQFAARVTRDLPELNVVVNNAGTMALEDPAVPNPAVIASIVATNLVGPMMLTSLLLPALVRQSRGAVINVTSALAFVPLAQAPSYCASKAGLHSYTESLRFLLRDSPIEVIEIAPPRVETDMTVSADDGHTMNLDDFVAETMAQLAARPDAGEVVVDAARAVRYAERDGAYAELFAAVNRAR